MAGEALFYLFAFVTILIVFLPSGMISARRVRARGPAEATLWYAEEDDRGRRRVSEVPASVAPWIRRGEEAVAAGWFRTPGEAMGAELAPRA